MTQQTLNADRGDFLDSYQDWCVGLLLNDVNDQATVRDSGLKPLPYCLDGIIEETEEVVEYPDKNPAYDRLEVVLGLHSSNEPEKLEIENHIKEFGDVSWYSAAALSLLGIRMSDSCKRAESEHRRLSSNLPSLAERHPSYYGLLLIMALDRLRAAAVNLYQKTPVTVIHANGSHEFITDPEEVLELKIILRRDDRISKVEELAAATGSYILTASEVLPFYFGQEITFEQVLHQNMIKIQKRIADNTVYKVDGVGGDSR